MGDMLDLFDQLDDAYMQCGTDPFDDFERGYENDGDGNWRTRMDVAKTECFLKDLNRKAAKNKPSTWRQRHPKDQVKCETKKYY